MENNLSLPAKNKVPDIKVDQFESQESNIICHYNFTMTANVPHKTQFTIKLGSQTAFVVEV